MNELDAEKNRLLDEVKPLQETYKRLYGHIDISQPVSQEEAELKKQIAAKFSRINQIVIEKRNLNTLKP
jgi:hypothetical protein